MIGLLPPPVPNRIEHPFVGQLRVHGLLVNIENEHGSIRAGTDAFGRPWRVQMVAGAYGEIARTDGADGEPVDVYVGPDVEAPIVYVVRQLDPDTDEADECKVMLGYRSPDEARGAYVNQYDKPGFYGGMWPMSVQQLKAWLKTGDPWPTLALVKGRCLVRTTFRA